MPAPPAADPQASIERFGGYLRLDPTNVDLRVALGDVLHQAGRFDEALACLREGLQHQPGNARLRGRIANVQLSLHAFDAAERTLRELLAETPDDPALLHNLGIALGQQGRWSEAQPALEAARSGGANAAETHAYLAHAWHHLGDTARALEAAQAWSAASGSAAAEGYLAIVEFDHGDLDSAFVRARAVLECDPDNVDASVVDGVHATEQQDMARAAVRFECAVRLEPDNPRGWVGVALARLHAGEHARAIEAFERALALGPRNTGTIVALGWARLTAQDYSGAEREFRRAIDVDATFGEAHGGLASALLMQNRRTEARQELERARRLGPQGFGHIYAQSVLLAVEGRRELGEKVMARAMERSVRPGSPSLIDYVRTFMRQREGGKPRLPPTGGGRR